MTINEAIDILSESAYRGVTTICDEFREAERLGIEALKRIRSGRDTPSGLSFIPLPGESE